MCTHILLSTPPSTYTPHKHPLSVNKEFFYSWVTKHDPIIPKLDSKLKKPPPSQTYTHTRASPSLHLYPFLPLSEDFIKAVAWGLQGDCAVYERGGYKNKHALL